MRTVTMKDIAEKAGVARQTVSEVLNKAPYSRVKKETRERILHVAAELRYRPPECRLVPTELLIRKSCGCT